MKAFTARCIQYVTLALMFLLFLCGIAMPSKLIIGIGALIGLLGTVVWLIFGRCPSCGNSLGRSLHEYCPYCGKKLK